MKVHFASGNHPFSAEDGWVNVDIHDWPGVDLKANLLDELPDQLSNIEVAYVGHFMEHLSYAEGVEFLSRVRQRMATSGLLVVVGPDHEKATQWFKDGRMGQDLFDAVHAHGHIPDDNPADRAGIHMIDHTGALAVEQAAAAGWTYAHEIPLSTLSMTHPGVPIIDASEWQFCVVATV